MRNVFFFFLKQGARRLSHEMENLNVLFPSFILTLMFHYVPAASTACLILLLLDQPHWSPSSL